MPKKNITCVIPELWMLVLHGHFWNVAATPKRWRSNSPWFYKGVTFLYIYIFINLYIYIHTYLGGTIHILQNHDVWLCGAIADTISLCCWLAVLFAIDWSARIGWIFWKSIWKVPVDSVGFIPAGCSYAICALWTEHWLFEDQERQACKQRELFRV